MSRLTKYSRTGAKCDNCIFSRLVSITDKKGVALDMCECHVARPTRTGFPTVRTDDFCGCHVDACTLERTFEGLQANA